MNSDNYFIHLKLRDSQLNAIIEIYDRHFAPKMPKVYDGRGVVALWNPLAEWETGKGFDTGYGNIGIISHECRTDPLWQEFSDLLPHMTMFATITKMHSGGVMHPHVDRISRPEAIYFPIRGCTDDCVSEYYDLPKSTAITRQALKVTPTSIFKYNITENAVLTNVHECHGVKNNSQFERIAFGWNMRLEYSFDMCKQILTELGYVK